MQNDFKLIKSRVDDELEKISSFESKSLSQSVKYSLSKGGKRLRPLLLVEACNAFSGSKEDAIPASVAIEILHNFTLVHDDIMDEDLIRHGRETVHSKWDVGTGVLTGDALLAIALNIIQSYNNLDIIKHFNKSLVDVCDGQSLDKEFENLDISLDQYMHMIKLKTGCLLGVSAQIGSVIGGANINDSTLMYKYGQYIGKAFQIQDDYLEVFSNEKKMGKTLKSDIVLNKKTFLMINGYLKNSQKMNEIKEIISRGEFELGQKKLVDFYVDSGIKDLADQKIKDLISEANIKLEMIENLNPDNNLVYFSKLILNRDK